MTVISIRRMAGRVRRAVGARLVPRRESLRNRIQNLSHRASPFRVIARDLTRAAGRRVRRSFTSAAPARVRVGIDIRPFYEPLTGVGWYLYNLVEQFSRREDIQMVLFGDPFVTDDGPRLYVSLPPGVPVVSFDFRGSGVPRAVRPLARAAFVVRAMLERPDVFFGANFFLPRSISTIARRRVITIHDLTYRRHPALVQDETLENLEREMTREILRADAIICVSESTRQDVLREYLVDPSKVVAIHSGIGVINTVTEPVPGLPGKYILFVGTIEPRKNLGVLLSAFESLRESGRYDGDLVIVGKVGWKSGEIVSRLSTSRWRSHLRRFDYLNPAQLATVYRAADLFVLPSIYEGFGFPILEAMMHGVPVIAARSSSIPEIGGDAAMYFDPRNAGELARLITTVSAGGQLRLTMIEKGRRRAGQFRWETTAEKTLSVFKRVATE